MAWIRKHEGPRGISYRVHWRDPGGHERSRTFALKKPAERFARGLETRISDGSYIDPAHGRESLTAFYTRWRDHAEEAGRPSERTLIAYDELWRLYVGPALGSKPLAGISRADVVDLVATAAARSAHRAVDALKVTRMLLNRAVAEDAIARNPATGVSAPRIEQQEPWVLDPEEVERLASAVTDRYRALVVLAAYSSLRWSELVALRVDRLDLMRRRLRVEEKTTEHGHLIHGEPKTRQSRRSVAIPDSVALEVAEHLRKYPAGPDRLVFTAPEGGPIRRPAFYRLAWKPATKAAGLHGFRFGNLRHTGASLAIAAGANPLLVAARLGHTSTRMVERHYVALFEGLDREIADRLGVMQGDAAGEAERLRNGSDRAPSRGGSKGS